MKNEKGISLIALIITIIVIIILAAIVIGSVLNAPDQANFAKYCQDYSEIQSAVTTQGALVYGELATGAVKLADTSATLSLANVYKFLCTATKATYDGATGGVVLPKAEATDTKVEITADGATFIGLSTLPSYVHWYLDVNTGKLTSSNFVYDNNNYDTPTHPTPIS